MDKKMFKVVITGETRMYPEGTTYREIIDESGIHTEAPVILVMVNGKLRELCGFSGNQGGSGPVVEGSLGAYPPVYVHDALWPV